MASKRAKEIIKRHTEIVPEGPDLASSIQQLAQSINNFNTNYRAVEMARIEKEADDRRGRVALEHQRIAAKAIENARAPWWWRKINNYDG